MRGRQIEATIAGLEEAAAHASGMAEAATLIIARHRAALTRADVDEYRRLVTHHEHLIDQLRRLRALAIEGVTAR